MQIFFEKLSKKIYVLFVSSVFVILFLEYFPQTYPLTSFENIPQTVKELSVEPANAVLVYPFGLRDGYTQDGQYEMKHALYQMHHKKNQLGGYISRLNGQVRKQYLDNDFIRDLIIMQNGNDTVLSVKNYSSDIDVLAFESAMIFQSDIHSQGAMFLDSVLTVNGYIRKVYVDGELFIRYH